MTNDFETDEQGNLIVVPLTGWSVTPIAESAVLLRLQYQSDPLEPESEGKSLQLALHPLQCLEVAEMLTRQVRRILTSPSSGQTPH